MTHHDSDGPPTSTFIVERYWPGVTRPALDAAMDRVRHALLDSSDQGEAVAHVATLLVDSDEVVFCLFRAASQQAVEAVNERAEFPFDRIVPGTWLSWVASDGAAHRRARPRRRMRGALAGLGVACALLIGACSAGAPPPSGAVRVSAGAGSASGVAAPSSSAAVAGDAPTAIDQCSFLTAAEIEAATGQTIVGMERDSGSSHACIWTLSRTNNKFTLAVYLNDPRAQKEQEFDCKVGFGLDPLPGVGDSACAGQTTGDYFLHTIRGDDRVTLYGGLTNKDDFPVKSPVWATLAQDVLAKLP